MFKYGWTDVHDEEQSRKPFIVSEWSCLKCWPKNLWMTVLHNFINFVWISTSSMHSSVRDYYRPGYHKFCTGWIPKMVKSAHEMQRLAWL
jgi:hypothetical protein